MKKVLLSAVACLGMVTGSYASNELVRGKVESSDKELSKEQDFQEEGFRGLCRGSAIVVGWNGQLQFVNMGKLGEDIVTESALDCAELYNGFIRDLSLIYPGGVYGSGSHYDAF